LDYSVAQPSNRAIPFTIFATDVLGLDEVTAKHLDRIDKVDAMLEDIRETLGLVPFEVHCS